MSEEGLKTITQEWHSDGPQQENGKKTDQEQHKGKLMKRNSDMNLTWGEV